jgi:hypothetical protein
MKVRIPSVKLSDGSESSDLVVIADTHRHFMGTLFQSPSADLKKQKPSSYSPLELASYLKDTIARLSTRDCAMLDAPLTANDSYWAIVTAGNERASGPDGLPAEYYKLSPSTWARLFEIVYASQLEKGRMSKFQRRAYLSLLYKSGDRSMPSNYRPLTLLNHDAKFGLKFLRADLEMYCRLSFMKTKADSSADARFGTRSTAFKTFNASAKHTFHKQAR